MVNRRIAIIPARGGSKRIPKKNITDFNGLPMIAWTIKAAKESRLFDRILVSTDDSMIAEVAINAGAEVPFLRTDCADDNSTVSEATTFALQQAMDYWQEEYNVVVQLMANCPLRTSADIQSLVSTFEAKKRTAQISCFEYGWVNPWWAATINHEGRPTQVFSETLTQRSQDLPKLYCPTGAIWISTVKALLAHQTFYSPDHTFEPIPLRNAMDIDDYEDLEIANALLLAMKAKEYKIVFRCDASIQIGSGHVMRCLTLADELSRQGAESFFICRQNDGSLIEILQQRGYQVYTLPLEHDLGIESESKATLAHADWLASTQHRDAELSISIVKAIQPDWLIVDHYALDESWEKRLNPYCKKLMVIDDLADRKHNCDVLLDQNFGRDPQDHAAYVNEDCELLCGSNYALLRPEFAEWRIYSLEQRQHNKLASILINLGGVDKDNITTKILKVLQTKSLPDHCSITIVMGSTSPWIEEVKQQAAIMQWRTVVEVGVNNMAEIMANSNLAIGAAGSTSWERCCLGLPTIMLVLAENQRDIANVLEDVGAALTFNINKLEAEPLALEQCIASAVPKMRAMSRVASAVTDGLGVTRLSKVLLR